MIYNQDEAKELLADVIAIRNAQQKEIAQLQYQATGRVPIYALSIGDFPPPMRNDPIACLRFFFCDVCHLSTPGEFDALTPDELKARVVSNPLFEKMKEFWNGKIDELNKGIAAIGADAKRGADAAESVDQKIKAPRADMGSKHRQRPHISRAWRSAKDVAADFNKSAFTPKRGKRKLGTCDEAKVNRWDAECPDYEHKNRWGYYAQLRIDPDLKGEYYEVLARWAEHWADYKIWDNHHPGVKFRPMRRTDIETARMGRDEQGDLVIEPRPDPRQT